MFKIDNIDIQNYSTTKSTYSSCAHPAFQSKYTKNALIKNWVFNAQNSSRFVLTTPLSANTEKYKNFNSLTPDIAKGKLKLDGTSIPVINQYDLFGWSSSYDYSTGYGTVTVKIKRITDNSGNLTSNYKISLYRESGSLIRSYTQNNIGIKMAGGGAAGGPGSANSFMYGTAAYNGGGGGAGAGIMLFVHIKGFNDTQEHTIMKFAAGVGGKINEGEKRQLWNQHPFVAGTYYCPGGGATSGEKSWVEVYLENSGSHTYHFEAGGAAARGNGGDGSSKAGGSPSVWYSNRNSDTNLGSISAGTKISDNNLDLWYIAGVDGGAGAARVNKGGSCYLKVKEKNLPSTKYMSSSNTDETELSYGYAFPSNESANLPDPVGPGWGGCSIFGKGDSVANSGGWYYRSDYYAYGAGGVGAVLTYLRPVIGGNVSMWSGTNGHDGCIELFTE